MGVCSGGRSALFGGTWNGCRLGAIMCMQQFQQGSSGKALKTREAHCMSGMHSHLQLGREADSPLFILIQKKRKNLKNFCAEIAQLS